MQYITNLPKVMFFDWNKTLSNSLFWEHLSDDNHPLNEFHDAIVDSLFSKHKDKIYPWMRGKISVDKIMNLIASDVNLSADTLCEELKISCENMKYVSDETPDLIEQVRGRGIEAVIATDNMDTFSLFTVPGLNLDRQFDDILNSFELGVLKEDFDENNVPLFFKDYMDQRKLKYDEVVLLDDCVDETGNYERLGFKIREVKSPKELIRIMKQYISL
ncbi:hypothetical protein JW887_00840 [Candidatus Dojkabacteria bacterium]|nr:hypothetical protein [Candidatus Dojkabacteria bacterium]